MTLTLLAPQGVHRPTGGNVYDRCLVEALGRLGVRARLAEVPGPWPDRSPAAGERLTTAASGAGPVLIDGLLASGSPAVVAALTGPVGVLAHLPVPLETGMPEAERRTLTETEAEALRAAHLIVCPSAWTACYVADTYRVAPNRLVVAHPGTPGARSVSRTRTGPLRLTCLAALTPRKNAAALLDALGPDLPWHLTIAGPDDADPAYAARLRAHAATLGERVSVQGAVDGSALERLWERTDLLVLPSLAETFGMVVTEAVSRGIPVVVVAGTGAQEALELAGDPLPGAAVDLADLPQVLRRWLTDATLRDTWRRAAHAAAPHLPSWDDAARTVAAAFALPASAPPAFAPPASAPLASTPASVPPAAGLPAVVPSPVQPPEGPP